MLGRIWETVKRHKKKFIFLGTVVGGTWYLYKYTWKKIQEIRDEEDKQYLILVRRQHHFDSNQRTCNMTVLAMVPSLKQALTKNLDTEGIKEMLKDNPTNKLDLWEELKVMSVTRTLAAVYGTCLLSVMLRVQLNLLGGYLYLDTLHPPTPQLSSTGDGVPQGSIPQKVQERYLSLVKQFIEQGFMDFIGYLKMAVIKEIGSLSLKQLVSLDQMTTVLGHIRERVECGVDQPTQALYPYLLTSERMPDFSASSIVVDPDEELFEKLIAETRDVLESKDFHYVLRASLDRGYSCVLDGLAEHFKQQALAHGDHMRLHEISIAMAKLTPVMNGLLPRLCGDAPNPYIQELLLMEELKHLAANVYEAFSQDPSEQPSI